jgi:hypothetical protein
MTDATNTDQLVRRALHDVHDAVREPAGLADRLIADVGSPRPAVLNQRSSRRWLAPLLAAAAVVALVSGIAVAAGFGRSGHHSPVTGTGPSASEPTHPAPSGSIPGRLSAAEIENATIDVPAWPTQIDGSGGCVSGPRKFTKGRSIVSTQPYTLGLELLGPVIATNGGVATAAVVIKCDLFEPQGAQAVLLTRDPSGRYTATPVVSQVLGPFSSTGPAQVLAVSDTTVVVRWVDFAGATQDRTYTRSNGRFVQTGGPTAFPS